MSSKLLLMRHAKSSWKNSSLADHDRPLNERGRSTAPRMARLLVENDLKPEKIYCSSARRAQETAELMLPVFKAAAVVIVPVFYAADVTAWEDWVRSWEDECPALAIGHNPSLEEFLLQLTGESVRMPTAAIAVLSRTRANGWTLRNVWRPREVLRD